VEPKWYEAGAAEYDLPVIAQVGCGLRLAFASTTVGAQKESLGSYAWGKDECHWQCSSLQAMEPF
jgi:hypothetical protein